MTFQNPAWTLVQFRPVIDGIFPYLPGCVHCCTVLCYVYVCMCVCSVVVVVVFKIILLFSLLVSVFYIHT